MNNYNYIKSVLEADYNKELDEEYFEDLYSGAVNWEHEVYKNHKEAIVTTALDELKNSEEVLNNFEGLTLDEKYNIIEPCIELRCQVTHAFKNMYNFDGAIQELTQNIGEIEEQIDFDTPVNLTDEQIEELSREYGVELENGQYYIFTYTPYDYSTIQHCIDIDALIKSLTK